MPSANRRTVDLITQLRTAAAALEQQPPSDALVLGARKWTAAELAQAFLAHADALVAADKVRREWYRQTGIIRAAHKADIQPALVGLRGLLAAQHGHASPELTRFGFVVRERAVPSTETKQAAVAKRRATRKARGTMGKRQRLAIKGVVEPASAVSADTSRGGARST